jgi:hypothetical protein
MSDNPVTGEVSNSKVAAVFDSEVTARAAATAVAKKAGLESAQVKVVTPGEQDPGIKLEPEGGGILRSIVVAHVRLGVVGLVVGAIAFALLRWMEVGAVVNSPWLSAMVMIAFGGVGGLMLGGLVALRPDHDLYILATREAMAEHRTTVVVHALSSEQADRAAEVLAGLGANVTRTL